MCLELGSDYVQKMTFKYPDINTDVTFTVRIDYTQKIYETARSAATTDYFNKKFQHSARTEQEPHRFCNLFGIKHTTEIS
jgi:outer membrane receptor for Fe3+-dicitrate